MNHLKPRTHIYELLKYKHLHRAPISLCGNQRYANARCQQNSPVRLLQYTLNYMYIPLRVSNISLPEKTRRYLPERLKCSLSELIVQEMLPPINAHHPDYKDYLLTIQTVPFTYTFKQCHYSCFAPACLDVIFYSDLEFNIATIRSKEKCLIRSKKSLVEYIYANKIPQKENTPSSLFQSRNKTGVNVNLCK